MSKVLVSEENLTNIANAIREKNGETTTYKPRDMAGAIQNIFGGGSTVTKGIVINKFSEDGYATDVSVVGMTSIPDYYFATYSSAYTNFLNKYLKNVQLPNNLTSIGHFAFNSCTNLALTKLPNNLTSIGNFAFQWCRNLALTELPSGITSIGIRVFQDCISLIEMFCLGNITSIENYAFYKCTNLSIFALPNIIMVPTLGSDVFTNTPIANGTGYIYVPDDLVESFKSATNWSTYANQIKAISEMEASA